jgi:GxxExxY protein
MLDTHDEKRELPRSELTRTVLGCCFEVMKELGPGFLERIYKNALLITMKDKGLQVETEKSFEVVFRNKVIGRYSADLVVERTVIIELKCCESLVREHQAQLFNYLKVSGLSIGLLINFRRRKLEYQRLHQSRGGDSGIGPAEESLPV